MSKVSVVIINALRCTNWLSMHYSKVSKKTLFVWFKRMKINLYCITKFLYLCTNI